MRFYELMESPETDREQRGDALQVYTAVVNYLSRGGEEWYTLMTKADDSEAYLLNLTDVGIDDDMWVGLVHQQYATEGEIGRMTMDGKYLLMYVPDLKDGLQYLKSKKYRTAFIHEYVHKLDILRHKKQLSGSGGTGDLGGYYNSPMEYNAYYQEAIHNFEEAMEGFKAHPTALTAVVKRISTFGGFFTFLRQYMSKTFIKYIVKDTAKRMLRRLYKYWEGLMVEYG